MYQLYRYVHLIIWLMCLDLPWLESAPISVNNSLFEADWRTAGPGDIPYQIAIKTPYPHRNDVHYTICNGFLIQKNKALSSARCYFSYDPDGVGESLCNGRRRFPKEKLYAVAGTLRYIGRYQKDGTEQWRRIDDTYIHSRYSFPYDNIAIAITTEPFVYNKYVKAIPYASKYIEYDSDSMDCEVSGYGEVSHTIRSDTLLRVKIIPITNRYCTFLNGEDMKDFICTKSVIGKVLQIRSGGPLMCRNTGDPSERTSGVIVGVLNGNDRSISTFTRVSSHLKFIESKSRLNQPTIHLCILLLKLIRFMIFFLFY